MNKMMTPYELMDLNQILTLEKAKELEGKTLLITSPEDRANDGCRENTNRMGMGGHQSL